MLDSAGLIVKYRGQGVLVDTNLLVLYLVGLVNIERIRTFKRTSSFEKDDFLLLARLLDHFGPPLISTPHVLSQISDLTDLSGKELIKIRRLFRTLIGEVKEYFDTARTIADSSVFAPWIMRCGHCDRMRQ
jgi:hypothetical protein